MLCLIGENFENSEEVLGAVVNIRGKGDKIGKDLKYVLYSHTHTYTLTHYINQMYVICTSNVRIMYIKCTYYVHLLSTSEVFKDMYKQFDPFKGIWTADAMNSQAVLEIGRKLKERLRISQKIPIGYQLHKDTIDKTGSVTKNSYTV